MFKEGNFIFEGDCLPPQCWSPRKAMPTAIIEAYMSEGFAVIADGLSVDEQKRPLRNSNQKIFLVNNSAKSLAYMLYGTTRITARFDFNRALDLAEEAQKAAIALADYDPPDLLTYATELCGRLQKRLADCKDSIDYPTTPDLDHPDGRCLIIQVFFCGYYRGMPAIADVKIIHQNQSLDLDPFKHRLEFGYRLFGSDKVADALLLPYGLDPSLSEYRTPAMEKDRRHLTLDEVIGLGASYIHACDSAAGHKIDPDYAPTIGGHVHAATITAKDGARWVEGYAPRKTFWD